MVIATALTMAPEAARACGRGSGADYSGLAAGLLGTVGLFTGIPLTLWDLQSGVASDHPSAAYGDVELVIAAPQVLLGAIALRTYGASSNGFFIAYTLWMGLLMSHGIWTIATVPPATAAGTPAEAPPPSQKEQKPTPLLQMGIGPTYVPVGPLAQPGIGLVGRF